MPKLKEFVKRAVGADGLEGHFVVCSSKAWYVNFVFKGRHIHLTDVNLWPRSQKRPNKLLWVFMSVLHTRKMYINIHHAHCIKSHIFVQNGILTKSCKSSNLNFWRQNWITFSKMSQILEVLRPKIAILT